MPSFFFSGTCLIRELKLRILHQFRLSITWHAFFYVKKLFYILTKMRYAISGCIGYTAQAKGRFRGSTTSFPCKIVILWFTTNR